MKRYGLVGRTLEYSYSKLIHEYIINKMKIDATYELIQTDDILNINLSKYDGLNFTSPFKEDVLGQILNRTDSVNIIKAANLLSEEKLYNTDTNGFLELYNHLVLKDDEEIKRVIILGNSKTAQTIKYALKDKEVLICSRKQKAGVITYDQEDLIYGDLIINTTILGQGKYASISAVDREIMSKFKYSIDVNYNPMRNQFLMDAAISGLQNINGLRMLIVQAIRSYEIWHKVEIDPMLYDEIYHYVVQQETIGTIFIGMPYSGKSFLHNLFESNGLDAVDTDKFITKKYGMTPQQIIDKHGEDHFRKIEKETFERLIKDGHKYIFTGGGIVKDLTNIKLLASHDVVYIDTSLDVLIKRFKQNPDGRALIKTEQDLIDLYEKRINNYTIFLNRKLTYDEIINLEWT